MTDTHFKQEAELIPTQLLNQLVCPENKSPLQLAAPAQLAHLNDAIANKTLFNRSQQQVETPLQGGLIRADQQWLYPIWNGIPVLLIDEAISLP